MTYSTRLTRRLALCYGMVKGAFKYLCRAPLGLSDHSFVYLVPSYRPVLRKHKPERRLVPVWWEESVHRLQDCFSCTDWDMFNSACTGLDELTDTVSSYVTFCEESVVPRKSITIFSNNKPWIPKSVKNIINTCNISFNKGDRVPQLLKDSFVPVPKSKVALSLKDV